MKLLYLTDIHGSFELVMQLLAETSADVYVVSGDLIDIPFYNMDSAIRYHELQSYFHGLRRRMDREQMIIEDFVDDLMEKPDVTDEIQSRGSRYQQYTIRARRVMQQKYKVLENIVSWKKAPVFCLPGNYDMDLKFTSLHERDLHMHWHQIDDLKIAGYGGADIWTAGIPERYVVRYKAGIGVYDRHNEMYNFFKAAKPDIIVTHQPAHGVLDRISFIGPSGSPALRTYCDNNPVLLCLTGHVHNEWGLREVENTIYLNPSNFGDVTQINGEVKEGGFFFEADIDRREVQRVLFRKLAGDRIFDIAEYTTKGSRWEEEIIDKERYAALQRNDNYDSTMKKSSHIPEIQLFNEIKRFFRMFQTPETEERVDRLEEVAKLVEERLQGEIAMDLVGSVNMGLSAQSSDIDFVLYLRCGGGASCENRSCGLYRQAAQTLREILGSQYDFEIIDCVDLSLVEKSILDKNYECETLQRFVAYRSICRPINYRVIAPLEDMLNRDMEFRNELEGSIRSYFKIFVTTSQHIHSFNKYELRLKSIGIRLPESIRRKIRRYLQEEE